MLTWVFGMNKQGDGFRKAILQIVPMFCTIEEKCKPEESFFLFAEKLQIFYPFAYPNIFNGNVELV